MAQGIRPQSKMHRRRPSSMCMQQLLLRALAEVADCTLGDSILEVGIHATEGETLMTVVACLMEGIVLGHQANLKELLESKELAT